MSIFYVGDEVTHPEFGNGVVVESVNNSSRPVGLPQPGWIQAKTVFVRFKIRTASFTADGEYGPGQPPSLSFRDGGFSYGTPPERAFVPTEPTWCRVSDSTDIFDNGYFLVVGYEAGIYVTASGTSWNHAKPCTPPEWANLMGDK